VHDDPVLRKSVANRNRPVSELRQQLLYTFPAAARTAVKDEADCFWFAEFIVAKRRSLTAFAAKATSVANSQSKPRMLHFEHRNVWLLGSELALDWS
jgi:hypothetical protein